LIAGLLPAIAGNAYGGANNRVALVVGNGNYEHAPQLDNPMRDARLISSTLKELGFALIGGGAQENLDRSSLEQAVRSFGRAIGPGTIALFYYSGHGLQSRGSNYLVPVSANLSSSSDIDFELVDLDIVVRQMDAAHASLNIIVLDACRNNPFGGRGLRDDTAGLAEMRAPPATIISYATQPGGVAQDGAPGGYSPYSSALAEAIRAPGIDVLKVFNNVGVTVSRQTNGRQTPWVAASPIEGEFVLAAAPAAPSSAAAAVPAGPDISSIKELLAADRDALFWRSVQATDKPEELESYLRQFPQGAFADLARTRLALMKQSGRAPAAAGVAEPYGPPVPAVHSAPASLAAAAQPKGRQAGDAARRDLRSARIRSEPGSPSPDSQPTARTAAPPVISGYAATAIDARGRQFFANGETSEGAAVAEALRQCHGGGDASCRIVRMAHAPPDLMYWREGDSTRQVPRCIVLIGIVYHRLNQCLSSAPLLNEGGSCAPKALPHRLSPIPLHQSAACTAHR
jgi:uncharacterized caspase-like protein